jgi:DNA-binding transcriptional MerR regulator
VALDTVSDSVKVYAMNTLPDQINEHKGFWGTSEELLQRAHQLAKLVGLDHTKINLRLVRYYSTEGVLDKPDRLGREAAYNFKHLLQLILARQLSENGVALSLVKRLTQTLDAGKLISKIQNPVVDAVKEIREEVRLELPKIKASIPHKSFGDDYEKIIAQIDDIGMGVYKLKNDLYHELSLQRSIMDKFFIDQDQRLQRVEYIMGEYKSTLEVRQNSILRHIIVIDGRMSEINESLKRLEAKLDKNNENKD